MDHGRLTNRTKNFSIKVFVQLVFDTNFSNFQSGPGNTDFTIPFFDEIAESLFSNNAYFVVIVIVEPFWLVH